MATLGAWLLVADGAGPLGRGVGGGAAGPLRLRSLSRSRVGVGGGARVVAPPTLSFDFRERLGTPAPIRSTRCAL